MRKFKNIIGNHWSTKTSNPQHKLRWWQSESIIQPINKRVCGAEVPGFSQGLIELVRTQAKLQLPFDKGISVGGGTGQKEMNLLRQGIVNEIEVYEYSEARIALGKKIAKEQSLEDRISFIHGDAFEIVPQNERYDFVHWNNSLHHMLDVDKAVECHYLLACINIIGLLSTSASL